MDLKLPHTHKQVFQTALFYIFVERPSSCCIFMSRLYYRYISINHEEPPQILEAGRLCLYKHLMQHLSYFIGSIITVTFQKKTLKTSKQLSFPSFWDSPPGMAAMESKSGITVMKLRLGWGGLAIQVPNAPKKTVTELQNTSPHHQHGEHTCSLQFNSFMNITICFFVNVFVSNC